MKRKGITVIVALLVGWTTTVHAQSVSQLMNEAEQLEKQLKEVEALFKYKQVLKLEPGNYKAVCKCSWLYNTTGFRLSDNQKKKEYYKQGLVYANLALKLQPKGAEANYLMSMSTGRLAQLSSPKERVSTIGTIKKYAEAAIQYNPSHALAHHILGRLNYRISNMNTAEKAAANILFGGVPKGFSNEIAIMYYEKAVKLDPTYILFRRDLAIAYTKVKEYEKARQELKKAISFPIRTPDDKDFQAGCVNMLEQLKDK